MERLTIPDEPIEGGVRRAIIDTREVRREAMTIYWALKKYEDTGLTPEEIMKIHTAPEEKSQGTTRWILVREQLPDVGMVVLATVNHSAWISDYGNNSILESEKTYHPENKGVYAAKYIGDGEWVYYDPESGETRCDMAEEERDLGRIYDIVFAWIPLPKPYQEKS